ncbi:MAG: biosynthetic-type acetolactate synthase large subunit [Clostridia bacterium]|nr:biosynthetic-type acetolactate synthase large subunit [Clostridia bacterium]
MMTGAQALAKGLEEHNVDIIFGYPGATIAPFYNELAKNRDKITHILVREEQNAAHMASGYARVSGEVGVCVVTSGPGATNLITGIATAYMDSIPIVAITGQVPKDQLGRDVFQEIDITGACAPFIKHSYLVKEASDIPRIMREAFYIASTGRPGPVLIDVPSDVQNQTFKYTDPGRVNIRGYKPTTQGNPKQISKVAKQICAAKRPLICAGGGVFGANAAAELRKLSRKGNIPVVTTMMGLSTLPTDDPLNVGMIGMHGHKPANYALNHADVLIIVGARVGDRAVQAPGKVEETTVTIHIDIDPAEIGKNMSATIPLVGDVRHILKKLVDEEINPDSEYWVSELRQMVREDRAKEIPPREGTIGPKGFMRKLGAQLDEDAYVVADVGQNQIWAGKYISVRKGRFLTSGGLGTMGYSLPAAIGVKFAYPDKQTICVCGDGSFQMSMNELSTMVENGKDIKIVLFNNNKLGMVNELQKKGYSEGPFGVQMPGIPDFCKLADAFGIKSRRISDESEIDDAIKEMLSTEGGFILECVIDPDESTMAQ